MPVIALVRDLQGELIVNGEKQRKTIATEGQGAG